MRVAWLAAGGLWAAMASEDRGAGGIDGDVAAVVLGADDPGSAAAATPIRQPRAQTLVEKIFSRLAGRPVQAGELVDLAPDWTFALDDGIGLIDQSFRRHGVERLAHPEKIALFFDHYAPADTPLHAHVQRVGRKLFERFGLPRDRLFEVGEGISHQVAVERAFVRPGHLVTNMDSHTITIGALGAIGCGIGGAEMAYLWAHGHLWFRVPESIRIELVGARDRRRVDLLSNAEHRGPNRERGRSAGRQRAHIPKPTARRVRTLGWRRRDERQPRR